MTGFAKLYREALAALHNGDREGCAELSSQMLADAPDYGPANLLRAVSLPDTQIALAAAHYAAACRNSPGDAEAWFNRAVFLEGLGQLGKAMECYRRAVLLDPLNIGALMNCAQIVRIHEYFEEALTLSIRLQQLAPDHPAGYTNGAIALQHMGRIEEADAQFALAAERSADRSHIDWEHHHSLLARERFDEAWAKYEARFSPLVGNNVDDLPFICPRWSGASGDHVLVYGEQGLGDQIMFASAIPEMAAMCNKVSLAVSPPLVSLFRASFPEVAVLALPHGLGEAGCADLLLHAGSEMAVDAVLPIGSLMSRFRTDRDDFPGTPYLEPSRDACAFWHDDARWGHRHSHQVGKFVRVGFCWASNPAPGMFHASRRALHKTMALSEMLPLTDIDGIDAVAITNNPLTSFPGCECASRRMADVSDSLVDLDRTAALLCNLDLLVTVDTGVAHLAGALGVPVWILLHKGGDPRWGQHGSAESYWYASARLYWQDREGEWSEVIARVRQDLIPLMASRAKRIPA